MSWDAGMQWLTGGNALILLPGDYGARKITKTFPERGPAVIKALHRAVTMPTDWGGREEVAPPERHCRFARLQTTGRNLILDGMACSGHCGPRRHTTSGQQLWRNFLVTDRGQFLTDIDRDTGHTIGCMEFFFSKDREAGAGSGDYALRIHETHDMHVVRCLWDGAWVHGLSWKNRSSGGVYDCFFRACGALDMDVGQSGDWTLPGRPDVPVTNSCSKVVIRRNRFAGAARKRNPAPYTGIRVKNVLECEIRGNEFLGSLEVPIHVNYVPRKGGMFFGRPNIVINMLPPFIEKLAILRNRFDGGRVIVNGRGRGEQELVEIKGSRGRVDWVRHGPFNRENIDEDRFEWPQFDRGHPKLVAEDNDFPVERSDVLLGA
jgi:hypothetical protein